MRPHPVEHVLESVLNACRMRVGAMPDARRCRSLHEPEPGSPRGHFHLIGTEECLLTGPTLQERIHLHSGDLVIILSGTRHMFVAIPRDHAELPVGGCTPMLYGEFEFPMGNTSLLLGALPSYLVVRSRDASQHFRELTDILRAAACETRLGHQIVINKLASSLLAFAVCDYAYQAEAPRGIFAALLDARIARVLQAIHDRSGEDWNIRSLASVAGMSRSTFALHFSTVMGVSPMRYVTSWRVGQAKQLLQDHRLSVATVAEMLGYSSEAAFRKLFKRVEGIGPGQARAAARSNNRLAQRSDGKSVNVTLAPTRTANASARRTPA